MPRILNGSWAAGVGGGIASVGRIDAMTPIAQWSNAGGTCWLSPGVALFQHGAHLETFNLHNGEHNENFDPQGSYFLAAGGGVYAAAFNDGVRISNQPGKRYPGYGIADAGPDGSVLLKTPDGLLDGVLYATVQAMGGSTFLALDKHFRPVAVGVPVPVTLPGRLGGLRQHGDLVIYHAEEQNGSVVLHHASALWGVVLVSGLVNCYRPDFEEQPDGSIVVLYATEEGEAPGQLVRLVTSRGAFAPISSPSAPPPIVLPSPVPAPKPAPIPEPTPVSIPNQLSTVQRIRGKYPTPLGAQHPTFLIEVAQATGAKLLRKDGGTHVTLPNGINVSQDILMFLDQGVDILSDAEGAAVASWQEKGAIAGEYIDVSGLDVPGTPPPSQPPPTQPPPAPVDLGPILAQLVAIRVRLDDLESRPAPMPLDLTPYAKKGDPITVTGHVLTYGLRSNEATWKGSIDK